MKYLIALSISAVFIALSFGESNAQRPQAEPFAPPEDATEFEMERIPDMPEDFSMDEEERRQVAKTAADVMEAMLEAQETIQGILQDSDLDQSRLQNVSNALKDDDSEIPGDLPEDQRDQYKETAEKLNDAEEQVIRDAGSAPEANGMDRDRYNMIIAHLQEEHPEEFGKIRELIQEIMEERGIEL